MNQLADYRPYYFGTLVSGVLCFSKHRHVDTHSARDCHNLCSYLAVDGQKVVEINHILFFVKFSSKKNIQNLPEKENITFWFQESVRFKGNARVTFTKTMFFMVLII